MVLVLTTMRLVHLPLCTLHRQDNCVAQAQLRSGNVVGGDDSAFCFAPSSCHIMIGLIHLPEVACSLDLVFYRLVYHGL
jgi:hypothetical protein